MTVDVSERASRHLTLTSAISALFVVFIHATTLKYDEVADWDSAVGQIQGLLSHNILHVALPLFFLNSAFFLFLNLNQARQLLPRLQRRLSSLVMPYLAWSGLWIIIGVFIGFVADLSPTNLLSTWIIYPVPGQLWFLRDLIFLVALAPLIFFTPSIILSGLCALAWMWWVASQTVVTLELRSSWYEMISNEAICWFLLGALGARFAKQVLGMIETGFPKPVLWVCCAIWLVGSYLPLPLQIAHGISVTAGTIFLLGLSKYLANIAASRWVAVLGSYSFLIYAGHHPAISVLQEQLMKGSSGGQLWHLAVYILAPIMCVAMLLTGFALVAKFLPPIAYLANGGRSLRPLFNS